MEHAEETTVHRRTLEVEKEETDELKQKYKVRTMNRKSQLLKRTGQQYKDG